tara:strand:+ start:287 stop:481 length:195 start_codon:yes stop_codon:yes gene_type:complete
MKSKAERMARHTANLRTVNSKTDSRLSTKSANREEIVKSGTNIYKKIKVENQPFYVKLTTEKKA